MPPTVAAPVEPHVPPPRALWLDSTLLFLLALAVLMVYRIAWPPEGGRDFLTYTSYYVDLWRPEPLQPFVMNWRTPLAPLFIGGLTELGGLPLVSLGLATCYATAATATYLVGAFWNRETGWLSAAALLAYPAYGALFREIASDALFASAFMVWAAMICWTTDRQTPRWYASHAVAVMVLALIRPSSQLFLVFAGFPWLMPGLQTRTRLRCAAAFAGTATLLLLAWCAFHAIRFGDFTVARGNQAITPLYRAIAAGIVHPDNGPATRQLARAMQADLLTHEPYRSRGIDAATALASGDDRVWADLVALSDRTWGWRSNYAVLRRVGIEAIRAQPRRYFSGVGYDLAATFGLVGYAPFATGATTASVSTTGALPPDPTVRIIPHSYIDWKLSTPDGRLPPIEQISNDPRLRRIEDGLRPPRPGSIAAARVFNTIGKMFPPPIVWLAAGLVGTFWTPGRRRRTFLVLVAFGGLVVTVTLAGAGFVYHMRVPFDPVFIVFGVAGFVRAGLRGPVIRPAAGQAPSTRSGAGETVRQS